MIRNTVIAVFLTTSAMAGMAEPAAAMQYKDVVDDGDVTGTVSLKDVNRIGVMGDRIELVSRTEGAFEYKADEATGEIFLTVNPSWGIDRTVNFFITTEKHHTYQLLLTVKDVPSEQLMIRNSKTIGKSPAEKWEKENPYIETNVQLIKAMMLDKPPKGFSVEAIDVPLEFKQGVSLTRNSRYLGGLTNGEIYTVKNEKKAPLTLSEKDFRRTGVRAIALDRTFLLPNETARLYVVMEVSGQ